MQFVIWLFGQGPELEIWQMTARGVAFFGLTLLLIRASGRRSFGQSSTFDACITVLLGAVLSRAVVGASPFWATAGAATALAAMHRLLAIACIRFPRVEDMVSGREIVLVRDGRMDATAMRRALLTERNLMEAIRQKLGDRGVADVSLAMLERDGKITVIGQGQSAHYSSAGFQ